MFEILESIWDFISSFTSPILSLLNLGNSVLTIVPATVVRITNYTTYIFGDEMGGALVVLSGFVVIGVVVNILLQLL